MKPFNLEEALAGKPVVNKQGRKVIQLHYFPNIKSNFKVMAHIENNFGENNFGVDTFTINGRYSDDISELDLFMAEPERWINIYWDEDEQKAFSGGGVYATELEAKENGNGQNYQTTIKINP